MRCKDHAEAVKQAKANANRSGDPWVVLSDTSGNWHAESSRVTSPTAECVSSVYKPDIREGECRITNDKRGWRVDAPNGDFCYQPSREFAIGWARRWMVAHNMATKAQQS